MVKFLADLKHDIRHVWREFVRDVKGRRYVVVGKEMGVAIPMLDNPLTRNGCFRPRRIAEADLNSYSGRHIVPRKDEVLAVNETGQFKVGDGVTMFKDLPWATRLPVIEHKIYKDI